MLIYEERGTTSFFPTVATTSIDNFLNVTNSKTDFAGAQILGFHFEGSYLNAKYKGGMEEEYIKNLSLQEFGKFKNVKMVTIEPELPGAVHFIKEVSKNSVVSLGHTDCDIEAANKAIERELNV